MELREGAVSAPLPGISECLKSRHGKFTLGNFSDRDQTSMIERTVNCDVLAAGIFFNIVFTCFMVRFGFIKLSS